MITRYLAIFPEFQLNDRIHEIRKMYDPIGLLVRPHITLVFPFQSEISRHEIFNHVQMVTDRFGQFAISIDGASIHDDYVFLDITRGRDIITELHDRLYTNILEKFLRADLPYIPHVTVARCQNEKIRADAFGHAKMLPFPYTFVVKKIFSMNIREGKQIEEGSLDLAFTPN